MMRYTKVVGQRTVESELFAVLALVRSEFDRLLPNTPQTAHVRHLVYSCQGSISGTPFDDQEGYA